MRSQYMCTQKLTSQLNLLHGTKLKKLKRNSPPPKKRTNILQSIGNSPGNRWSQSWKRKGKQWWEGLADNEGFKTGMKEWGWWKGVYGQSVKTYQHLFKLWSFMLSFVKQTLFVISSTVDAIVSTPSTPRIPFNLCVRTSSRLSAFSFCCSNTLHFSISPLQHTSATQQLLIIQIYWETQAKGKTALTIGYSWFTHTWS